MASNVGLDVRLLRADASESAQLMRAIAELVNRVYAVAEAGQWLPGTSRTTVAEVTELTRAGEIIVARLGGGSGAVVGVVRVKRLEAEIGEVGMLAADLEHRHLGIGRELSALAIDLLRERGVTTIQKELLAPRHWHQPSKRFMADWFERRDFKVVRRGGLEELYPRLAPLLATPCDLIIYQKPL